jgi:two-component system, NtrC family, sensor kinase
MNIAVVGGGSKCLYLLNFIENHEFYTFPRRIVAVADLDDNAVGMVEARKRGYFVTRDYNDFFARDDIDVIIELAGSIDIYNDILVKKRKDVIAIHHATAMLFWEMDRMARKEREARTIYDVMINNLIEEDTMVINTDYVITDINETMCKKMGLKREDAIGHHCYEITHHRDTPCRGVHHPCPLSETLQTGQSSRTTHIHLDKDEKELYYSISCYPFKENDEIKGVIELSRDITQEIKSQQRMMQHEKLMSIGRLSAGVAHEINNPLTTILTSAMLIQEDLDPQDPMYEELSMISRETLRCRKIVQSLLDFARQSTPRGKTHDLNEIITESMYLTKKQAEFSNVRLESMLSEDLPPVFVDKDQIQQTMINLILNAIEATEPGGAITLGTEYSPSNRICIIQVEDTGCGIPKEHLNSIFDPFFTTRASGTGLGLAITHSIIEQHGGKITVESTPGKGTSFSIMLPVKAE